MFSLLMVKTVAIKQHVAQQGSIGLCRTERNRVLLITAHYS